MNPTSDAILAQLDRLCASSALANSPRLNRFLRFVVERALAGDSERLKEYLIGIEVFDRDQQYDPRIDSIVRVEAGRLRTKLDEYYRAAGRLDPVVISMQRGSYAPAFAPRASDPRPETTATPSVQPGTDLVSERSPRRALPGMGMLLMFSAVSLAWLLRGPVAREATIAVLPFSVYATNSEHALLATRITEGVSAELVRNGTLGVVSSTSARQLDASDRTLRELATALDADWLLQGRLRIDGNQVDVEAVLVLGASDRKAWVEGFRADVTELDALERRIATAVAAATRRDEP